MNIKVLGTGCKKCKQLEEHVNEAVAQLGIEAQIEKVEDIPTIMKYGVMSTPALVLNEKVVSTGKLLTVADLKEVLK